MMGKVIEFSEEPALPLSRLLRYQWGKHNAGLFVTCLVTQKKGYSPESLCIVS